MKRSIKQKLAGFLAAFLAVALLMPDVLPARAEEAAASENAVKVGFNTGNGEVLVGKNESSDQQPAEVYFAEDGSYTIQTELNAFFPYEVQFTCDGKTSKEYFLTPDSHVEVGGHTFYVETEADGTAVTQMSLEVGGDTVIVYPEKKQFPNTAVHSLLPLKEVTLSQVDLSAYTPVELTQVSVKVMRGNELAVADKIIWKSQSYNSAQDEYVINQVGDKIDLSVNTYSSASQNWEMIVGSGDQLDADAVRYQLPVKVKQSRNWLTPEVYMQDDKGVRTGLSTIENNTYYNDSYSRETPQQRIYVGSSEVGNITQAYVSLKVNPDVFEGSYNLRAYEGGHASAEEAMAAEDITDKLFCTDMAQADAGYLLRRNSTKEITLVSFDESGAVTGCLPIELYLYTQGYSLSSYSLTRKEESGHFVSGITSSTQTSSKDGCVYSTYTLYKGYAANENYYKRFALSKDGVTSTESVLGAYLGLYKSVEEAKAAGAVDIKEDLFGANGYAADYSEGVYITIIAGSDETKEQEIWKYCIKTEEGTTENPVSSNLSSGTSVSFGSFKTAEGKSIPCYFVSNSDDSYGEFNFVTVLVDKDVTDEELANLAPVFSLSYNAKLYAEGSSAPEESGKSFHDFTGAVQYTVAAEDGESAKSYWVQVVRATEGEGWLYFNSQIDPGAESRVEDGVIYSKREALLDSYHKNVHDILLANMGTEPMKKLAAELESDTLELDDYWTLKGEEDLLGFEGVKGYQPAEGASQGEAAKYGELWNLAKVRLMVKDGVAAGTDVSGTLTIKADGKALIVLALTGTAGDPSITTTEIPQAVKYVPYGTMIQNSNKYSWNKVSYALYSGRLPEGMIIKPNGEIYGVPRQTGKFTFTVRMTSSNNRGISFGSSTMTYTLEVNENTDANVDSATDQGYELSQRIQGIDLNEESSASQTLVSQGEYEEFQAIYLDGVELQKEEDYTAESGSTRITIRAQTLAGEQGKHTLGIEFRVQGEDILKRAAQNYEIGYGVGADAGDDREPDSGDDEEDDEDDDDTEEEDIPQSTPAPQPTATPQPTPEPQLTPAPQSTAAPQEAVPESSYESPYFNYVIDWEAVGRMIDAAAPRQNIDVLAGQSVETPAWILEKCITRDVALALHVGNGMALSVTGREIAGRAEKPFEINMKYPAQIPASEKESILNGALAGRIFEVAEAAGTEKFSYPVKVHFSWGSEYAGKQSILYYYDKETGRMTLAGVFTITQTGHTMFDISRSGGYIAVVHSDAPGEGVTGVHTVVSGDTMSRIAAKYKVTLDRLIKENPWIKNANKIYPGDKIVVR